jgi:hypothetical protein
VDLGILGNYFIEKGDRTIYIFAGEELQIKVNRDGTWEFLK